VAVAACCAVQQMPRCQAVCGLHAVACQATMLAEVAAMLANIYGQQMVELWRLHPLRIAPLQQS
jgi:hypothetical protein